MSVWLKGISGFLLLAVLGVGADPALVSQSKRMSRACPFEKKGPSPRRHGLTGPAPPHSPSALSYTSAAGAPPTVAWVPRKNFIDEYVFAKMDAAGVPSAGLCSDGEFIRRVYLDLTGRIPTADAVREFQADPDPGKRDRLVDGLIGTPAFIDRWTMWFGDLLRNTLYPTSAVGRNLLYEYVRDFVAQNWPYDQVAADLITGQGDSFFGGPVNYLMRAGTVGDIARIDSLDDMAVTVTRDFLGVKTQCISCHQGAGYLDGINLWLSRKRREDLWAQAAFFASLSIEARRLPDMMNYRYNVFEGGPGLYDPARFRDSENSFRPFRYIAAPVRPRYIGDEAAAPGDVPTRAHLARRLTADVQFARAAVNYLWAALMGRGIVDPPDGFDLARLDPNNPPAGDDGAVRWWQENEPLQPSHPELLEALAREFIAVGFDVRYVMALICKSGTYQLSSHSPGDWRPEYERFYARRSPRLLTAEEIHDAVLAVTGVPAAYVNRGTGAAVEWAMQLYGPEEPSNHDPNGPDAKAFLDAFGRGDRDQVERGRNKLSVFQPLGLMHSELVNRRVDASRGVLQALLGGEATDEQLVETLFLAALARRPSEGEQRLALGLLKEDRSAGAEDLLWSLLNRLEFIFNY